MDPGPQTIIAAGQTQAPGFGSIIMIGTSQFCHAGERWSTSEEDCSQFIQDKCRHTDMLLTGIGEETGVDTMQPLIVLVTVFLLLVLPLGWWTALRIALAIMFLLTASAHWGKRRADLIRMVPAGLLRRDLLVTITGFCEILGAVGLLYPRRRQTGHKGAAITVETTLGLRNTMDSQLSDNGQTGSNPITGKARLGEASVSFT